MGSTRSWGSDLLVTTNPLQPELLWTIHPPSTTIRYGLPDRSHVSLAVYNTLGQQVAVLQNGEQEAGYHDVRFDASALPSGVYFLQAAAGNFVETRKLLLVR